MIYVKLLSGDTIPVVCNSRMSGEDLYRIVFHEIHELLGLEEVDLHRLRLYREDTFEDALSYVPLLFEEVEVPPLLIQGSSEMLDVENEMLYAYVEMTKFYVTAHYPKLAFVSCGYYQCYYEYFLLEVQVGMDVFDHLYSEYVYAGFDCHCEVMDQYCAPHVVVFYRESDVEIMDEMDTVRRIRIKEDAMPYYVLKDLIPTIPSWTHAQYKMATHGLDRSQEETTTSLKCMNAHRMSEEYQAYHYTMEGRDDMTRAMTIACIMDRLLEEEEEEEEEDE